MNIETHLAILQQAEYDLKRYLDWLKRHPVIEEVKPKAKTAKFVVLFVLTKIFTLFAPVTTAIRFALRIIAIPQQLAVKGILLLARARLRFLQAMGLKVVAIAGSYAKTSTKHIMAQVLSPSVALLETPESVNTPLGIAFTILKSLSSKHKLFVVELGAYGIGEIAELMKFVRPSYGILTPIGLQHLERFGSKEQIVKAKSEIITTLSIPALSSDSNVTLLSENVRALPALEFYGFFPNSLYDVSNIRVTRGGTECVLAVGEKKFNLFVPLFGKHNLTNILPSLWIGEKLDVPLETLIGAISMLKPVPHRLEPILTENNVLILDNGYNTNPDSARDSLTVLKEIPGSIKMVVTPGFVELGDQQEKYDFQLGTRLAEVADVVAITGTLNKDAITEGLKTKKFPAKKILFAKNEQDAVTQLQPFMQTNGVLLFEGGTPEVYQ